MDEEWNELYSKKFGGSWYPNEGIVRFTARFLKRRNGIDAYEEKRKINRLLDAGCGNGRHVIFFAEQGFNTYGIDISKEGVEIASAWLNKRGLDANLNVGDIEKMPYENEFFDAIVSFGVLDHITFSKAKAAMNEIKRVLAPKGYVYLTLRSTEDSEFDRGEAAGRNTFVLQEGYEKGIIQHFFDIEEIKELFEGFKIFDIEVYEERFPELYTVDKAFLQSSTGMKKYIDLSKPIELNKKYSRWYIAAEKI